MQIRTDLAMEARELAGEDSDGIELTKRDYGDIVISSLLVKTDKAAQNIGKDRGNYITAEMNTLTDEFKERTSGLS